MKRRFMSCILVIIMIISICSIPQMSVNAGSYVVPPEEYDAEAICSHLPDRFNLRDYGYVSSIKYQLPFGLCWCFATCASLESNALMKGFGEYDLSERHLGYFASHLIELGNEVDNEGFDYTRRTDRQWYNIGGLSCGVINTLMKGYGVALEEKYPYENTREAIPSQFATDCVLRCKRCMTIPTSETEEIKKAIVRYGALYAVVAPMAWDGVRTWNVETSSVYVSEEMYSTIQNNYNSHAVNIVGWDDNYSRENFKSKPPGDGAWIVKNSLGEEWGDEGYCYLSYYDASIAHEKYWVAFEAAPMSYYETIHQYDGGVGQSVYEATGEVAIRYKATEDETITGVAIKPQQNCIATVNVYRGVKSIKDIDNAESIYTQEYKIDGADYQTIDFKDGVNVDAGDTIFVTVAFSTGIPYSIDLEEVVWNNTNAASADKNETYVKKYRSDNWNDLATCLSTPANACIKVFAKKGHDRRPTKEGDKNIGVTNFYVDTDTSHTNILKWSPVENAESYNIYRKSNIDKSYSIIANVAGGDFEYYDTDIVIGRRYSYMVIGVWGTSEGASLERSVTAVTQTPLIKLYKFISGILKAQDKVVIFLRMVAEELLRVVNLSESI